MLTSYIICLYAFTLSYQIPSSCYLHLRVLKYSYILHHLHISSYTICIYAYSYSHMLYHLHISSYIICVYQYACLRIIFIFYLHTDRLWSKVPTMLACCMSRSMHSSSLLEMSDSAFTMFSIEPRIVMTRSGYRFIISCMLQWQKHKNSRVLQHQHMEMHRQNMFKSSALASWARNNTDHCDLRQHFQAVNQAHRTRCRGYLLPSIHSFPDMLGAADANLFKKSVVCPTMSFVVFLLPKTK